MLPQHELQGAAPHSYLFTPFIQDLDKLSRKPACWGKQSCEEQQRPSQPFSPRSKKRAPRTIQNLQGGQACHEDQRKESPAPSEARGLRLGRPSPPPAPQQTEALTSQPVQLAHPAVFILLRDDLQEKTGLGSGPAQTPDGLSTRQAETKHAQQHQLSAGKVGSRQQEACVPGPHTP